MWTCGDKLTDERIREIARTTVVYCFAKPMPAPEDAESAIESAIRQALAEAQEWRDMESAPKSGEFLIEVYEGDWNNPKQRRSIYHATGYPSGPSWAMKGHYRTEEGGAYVLSGWRPLP